MEHFKKDTLSRSYSQGTLPELLKRKREETEKREEDKIREDLRAFGKSHKITRSPTKEEQQIPLSVTNIPIDNKEKDTNMEEAMHEMKGMIQNLMTAVASGNTELREQIKKCEEGIMVRMEKREEEWREERKELKEQIESITTKVQMLEEKIEKGEQEKRRQNIVIKGEIANYISEPLNEAVKKICKDNLGVEIEVDETYSVPVKKEKNKTSYMIVARLKNMNDKKLIMRNKPKLRKINSKIFIDDDLTLEERKTRKEIVEWNKREENKDRKVKIGYKKVKVGEEWVKWENFNSSLQEAQK